MIEKYLNTITKSQDKLDGHAICPYANKFKENILICETDDMKKMFEYYTINFPADKKVVVIISKPEKYDYETLTNYCSIYQSDKLWLAPDNPKHYNEIGGIKTNNEDFTSKKESQDPRRIITKKIGRNEPCPCGSGKKYKQCHGN